MTSVFALSAVNKPGKQVLAMTLCAQELFSTFCLHEFSSSHHRCIGSQCILEKPRHKWLKRSVLGHTGWKWQRCLCSYIPHLAASLPAVSNTFTTWNDLTIYIAIFIWKAERKRERDLPSVNSLSPNSCNSQSWAWMKPGARNPILVSCVSGQGQTTQAALGCFPRQVTGN